MILFPNAKINVGLYITEKLKDGFHNIETVFLPIALCDILEIVENKKATQSVTFSVSGLAIPGKQENNLIVKAYELLKKDFNLPSVSVHLHKAIPMGAGMGGGSSDGAFMLKGLNEMFSLGINADKLKDYASCLGSDCPFFIYNIPAVGRKKGEDLYALSIDISGLYIVTVTPPVFINTAEAFGNITPLPPDIKIEDEISKPPAEWKYRIRNMFEDYVFALHPSVKNIKDTLYNKGALYASLSGSGSTVSGIFNQSPNLSGVFPENYFIYRGPVPI